MGVAPINSSVLHLSRVCLSALNSKLDFSRMSPYRRLFNAVGLRVATAYSNVKVFTFSSSSNASRASLGTNASSILWPYKVQEHAREAPLEVIAMHPA